MSSSGELEDWFEFAEAKPLVLPIGGKKYTVPPVNGELGFRLLGVLEGTDKSMEKLPGRELWKLLLGPVWDEMLADDVPIQAMTRAGFAALAFFQGGHEKAADAWRDGVSPEALAAAQTAASSGTGKTNQRTRQDAANSGTASGTTTRPRKPAAKAVSRGRTSSSTGS